MTQWVFIAMLIASDGSRAYHAGDPYSTSTQCFEVAEAATRHLMEARRGWAYCVPDWMVDSLLRQLQPE
jgi:hypothetical protein